MFLNFYTVITIIVTSCTQRCHYCVSSL